MKTSEKFQLAGVIVTLGILSLGVLNFVTNLKIDSSISFHIKMIYVLIYLIFIVLGVIMFKVYTNEKRKINKTRKGM